MRSEVTFDAQALRSVMQDHADREQKKKKGKKKK